MKMVVYAHSAFTSEQSETELWLPALEFQASFTADDGIINKKNAILMKPQTSVQPLARKVAESGKRWLSMRLTSTIVTL